MGQLGGSHLRMSAIATSASTRLRWVASGALLRPPTLVQPPPGLVGIAIAAWLSIDRERRRGLIPFLAGISGGVFDRCRGVVMRREA